MTAPVGKNGGIVLGKRTSATTPSSSSSEIRRSSFQFRSRVPPERSLNGFEYLARQASNSSRYLASR